MNIGIIGSGPAGVCCAIAICNKLNTDNISIHIYDPGKPFRGRAFDTDSEAMLLNTSIAICYIDPQKPNKLFEYLHKYYNPDLDIGDVVPRYIIRNYFQYEFNRAIQHIKQARFIQANVDNVIIDSDDHLYIQVGNTHFGYDVVILATGLKFKELPHKYQKFNSLKPYPTEQLDAIPPNASVLILGCHLSSVDTLMHLAANKHKGAIGIHARRPFFPAIRHYIVPTTNHAFLEQYHLGIQDLSVNNKSRISYLIGILNQYINKYNMSLKDFIPSKQATLYSQLNKEIQFCLSHCNVWEKVLMDTVDCLSEIWPALSEETKCWFDTKINPWLGRMIQSMPLRNALILRGLFKTGQLSFIGQQEMAQITPQSYDYLVNATGLQSVSEDSLIQKMHESQLVRLNGSGGLSIDADTHRLNNHAALYALGSLTQGEIFAANSIFCTANGAEKIARHLANIEKPVI